MSGNNRSKKKAKRTRQASIREQDEVLDSLLDDEKYQSDLRIFKNIAPEQSHEAYPFRFGGDPFAYYRLNPYYSGGQPGYQQQASPPIPQKQSLQSSNSLKQNRPQAVPQGYQAAGGYPYGYPYYPYQYSYLPQYPYPPQYQGRPPPYNMLPEDPESESEDEQRTTKSGMMSIDGRRPLFLVALFVVSIAVLLVSFPLTLLSAGYIGPLGLIFACGPFATVFAFWAIYLTPCECYPNVEWAVSRIRVFATTAAVFDAVGTIGTPISMYGAQCPDDDDTMLGCEDELPAAKGISMAVAVVLGTHCFLCILVRSNARKLAESKFADERTEGIVLSPTPFRRK